MRMYQVHIHLQGFKTKTWHLLHKYWFKEIIFNSKNFTNTNELRNESQHCGQVRIYVVSANILSYTQTYQAL